MINSLQEQFAAIASAQWSKTEGRQSWLLNYLPALYASDNFMNRYLLIFEDTLRPLQLMVENMSYYFDPLTSPREVMEWLATWVSLTLDESWPEEQRRRLIRSASELYSWRGTQRGLTEFLQLYTGVEADISEYEDGMVLGSATFLGLNTQIAGREGFSFTVTMLLKGLTEAELVHKEAAIRRIIEMEKPAHTAYRLRLITDEKDYIEKVTPKARVVTAPAETDVTKSTKRRRRKSTEVTQETNVEAITEDVADDGSEIEPEEVTETEHDEPNQEAVTDTTENSSEEHTDNNSGE